MELRKAWQNVDANGTIHRYSTVVDEQPDGSSIVTFDDGWKAFHLTYEDGLADMEFTHGYRPFYPVPKRTEQPYWIG